MTFMTIKMGPGRNRLFSKDMKIANILDPQGRQVDAQGALVVGPAGNYLDHEGKEFSDDDMHKFQTAATRTITIKGKTFNENDITGHTWNELGQLANKRGNPLKENNCFLGPAGNPFTDEAMLALELLQNSDNDEDENPVGPAWSEGNTALANDGPLTTTEAGPVVAAAVELAPTEIAKTLG
eukprot:CAMPEP_0172635038 /NCGR_PEP_ID=MMETSP1068-20121228/197316_1 /TAXON_ID=35684 /ORGANISM="Pseudopedinella elastica, Strain CCMP716" /LENGTH=181 /DNA_ID=CAMNT_0013447123 /DNA_START=25 /DNA_END=567 /DNA_ORIENTATION=-